MRQVTWPGSEMVARRETGQHPSFKQLRLEVLMEYSGQMFFEIKYKMIL